VASRCPQTSLAEEWRLNTRVISHSALGHRRSQTEMWEDVAVDVLVERLDARLREWKPETAAHVRECVAEVIDLADKDVLDLVRPRATEQEVLDLLDEPTTG
jgi:hypothetical protein